MKFCAVAMFYLGLLFSGTGCFFTPNAVRHATQHEFYRAADLEKVHGVYQSEQEGLAITVEHSTSWGSRQSTLVIPEDHIHELLETSSSQVFVSGESRRKVHLRINILQSAEGRKPDIERVGLQKSLNRAEVESVMGEGDWLKVQTRNGGGGSAVSIWFTAEYRGEPYEMSLFVDVGGHRYEDLGTISERLIVVPAAMLGDVLITPLIFLNPTVLMTNGM